MRNAVDAVKDVMGIEMELNDVGCHFKNDVCIGDRCPFHSKS